MSSQRAETDPPTATTPTEITAAPQLQVPPASTPTLKQIPVNTLEAHHTAFAAFHEEYVRHYIEFADAKAGVCFGIISAVLGYIVSKDEIRALILKPTCSVQFGIVILSIMLLVVAVGCAFAVIAPRLSSKTGEGLVFFGAVSARESEEVFLRDVSALSEAELTALRLKHCFDISKVCSRKYDFLRRAIWLALPGLILALLAILIL